jgi:ribonucrease Y
MRRNEETPGMEILLAALVAAAVAVAVVLLVQRPRAMPAAGAAVATPPKPAGKATDGQASAASRPALDEELVARRAEIARLEERLAAKEQSLELQTGRLVERERSLEDRERNVDRDREGLKEGKREQIRELERLSGLSAGQAKQILLRELEDELRHESARLVRQVEDETRRDADRRARSILSAVMQRVASGHAVETTVSMVELKSDELKGRIIGREGRNIRALEMLTGIDFIIDDTPGAVLLSGFDGVRREIARLTLVRLLQDGRIHPARIEEAYHQSKSEIDQHIVEVGEQAVFEANVGSIHPELVKLLGKLRFRTSYGQNVLHHSVECARLASMLADELGADPRGGGQGSMTSARPCPTRPRARTPSSEASSPGATRSRRRSRTQWRHTTTRSSSRP